MQNLALLLCFESKNGFVFVKDTSSIHLNTGLEELAYVQGVVYLLIIHEIAHFFPLLSRSKTGNTFMLVF